MQFNFFLFFFLIQAPAPIPVLALNSGFFDLSVNRSCDLNPALQVPDQGMTDSSGSDGSSLDPLTASTRVTAETLVNFCN